MKRLLLCAVAAGLIGTPAAAFQYASDDAQPQAGGVAFTVTPQISDQTGVAPVTDGQLLNPWGLSQAPGGPLWVANNHSWSSTVYDKATFAKQALSVFIPAPGGGDGSPTGTVYAPGSGFQVTQGTKTGHSVFLFDTEEGAIEGWSPGVNSASAIVAVDNSSEGAVYKGMTIGMQKTTPRLFTADFANNRVEIYDEQFQRIGMFTDTTLPQGYSPFNVQVLNNKIYVAFALKEDTSVDEVAGAGLGYVDVFNVNGRLIKQLVAHGRLNAPWGMVIAPNSFGPTLAGALLVGNFGDGRINAYNADTGAFIGRLNDSQGKGLQIDGLWALWPGPNGTLTYTAGPEDETHGVIGSIGRVRNH